MRAACGSPPEKPAGLLGSLEMSLRQAGIPLGPRARPTLGEDPARENLSPAYRAASRAIGRAFPT